MVERCLTDFWYRHTVCVYKRRQNTSVTWKFNPSLTTYFILSLLTKTTKQVKSLPEFCHSTPILLCIYTEKNFFDMIRTLKVCDVHVYRVHLAETYVWNHWGCFSKSVTHDTNNISAHCQKMHKGKNIQISYHSFNHLICLAQEFFFSEISVTAADQMLRDDVW